MSQFHFGHFYFDNRSGCLFAHYGEVQQKEIPLRNKVANLLAYLLEHKETVVGKEELLEALWQHGDYRENALTQSVRELRIALGDNAQSPTFIKTFPQRGYQWIYPVEQMQTVEEETQPSEPSHKRNLMLPWLAIGCLFIISITALTVKFRTAKDVTTHPVNTSHQSDASSPAKSLLILPFINETQDESMAWLELGLADMLAVDMQRQFNNAITPPAQASSMLNNAELLWPALPSQIRTLLNQQDIDAALYASVRIHNQSQVLDFQLIYANGRTHQGSISFTSLPAETGAIGQQLKHLLDPQHTIDRGSVTADPLASQAIAKGMQALQKGGAKDALRFFDAARLISPKEYWAVAYAGRTNYALGRWRDAENMFAGIPNDMLKSDVNLAAFVEYWLAELSYRRGDPAAEANVEKAIVMASNATNIGLLAKAYRLQASIAWQQRKWVLHDQLQLKANRLFGGDNSLAVQADKLFYLGNPSNPGLEKSPSLDLKANHQKLYKSLNFYRSLNNEPMIAANLLAIAQNYALPLSEREQALYQSLDAYNQLQLPYELAQAQIYAGFYQMQLHNGFEAEKHFVKAGEIAQMLGAKPLQELVTFYLAFATLDQGLDQSSIGKHSKNNAKLEQSVKQLEGFINSSTDQTLVASALVFLGWANAELNNIDLALAQLEQAKSLNLALGMETTMGYAAYSIMRIYLQQGQYDKVVAMKDKVTTRFQATFTARAYFELGQYKQAINVMNTFKKNLPSMWQKEDDVRLLQYHRASQGERVNLLDEPKAHVVYCESDWLF